MGNEHGIISIKPPSYGIAGAKSARIDASLKAKLEKFKSDNRTNLEFEHVLSQYEYDIKDGDYKRISQQAPKLYEALLKAGIAPKSGVDYNNYKIIHGHSIFSEESNKLPTPKTPTEDKQNALNGWI
ncbi:hypothetical protein J6Q66_08100 [bacterium]|nr:hypothetical protein [bacterium]